MPNPDPTPRFIEVNSFRLTASELEDSGSSEAAIKAEEDAITCFLANREVRPNTKRVYERQLRRFQRWLKGKTWEQVTEWDLTCYKNYLKETPNRQRSDESLSAATINQAIAAIQSFFKWLSVKRYIQYNPVLTLEKVKADPVEVKDLEIRAVRSLEDALAFRGQLEVRDRALLEVFKHGLRAEEVSGLNVGDYHNEQLHIREAKWDSVGTVPLSPQARQALDSYLGWRLSRGMDVSSEAPLFLSQSRRNLGKRLGYRAIYNVIKDLAQNAGLEDIHPHRLRHTFGTQLIAEGMNPEFARKLMRIKSPQVFERYTKRGLEQRSKEAFYEVIGRSQLGLFGESE